ncbi:MAG: patatin-like phospholipase family protein [Candidatus Marinimicrobia bacterium]|nr:patatin-like phospholipase family protein [Candidatus Neomarinimicrobiota bacterium]MCF7828223.1 patatin-like phospholipase family protein [Candidatus Neomarinimicrobiota bacterium]MCF7879602.1 patatin-like phospholipase family protein [Candidatus Neomarinimicrobiota bacterium]
MATFIAQTEQYESHAFPGITYRKIKRPKIGLALSGGGMKGIAHAGVLHALRKNDIPIDNITGTSAGSIIGGLYALGYSVEEIDSIAKSIDYETLFIDQTQRRNLFISQKQQASKYLIDVRFDSLRPYIPISITPGQGIGRELTSLYMRSPMNTIRNFDNYRVRFRAVATALETGNRVVIGQGDWVHAIRASMSIPMVLAPVRYQGHRLIDGGVADNIPISLSRDLGADIVIAVDVRAKLYEPKELKNLLTVADQVINILMNTSRDEALDEADIVISPNFQGDVESADTLSAEYIRRGYKAGEQAAKQIRQKIQEVTRTDTNKFTLDRVNIIGNSHLTDGNVLEIARLNQVTFPVRLTGSRIDSSVTYLIGSAYFTNAVAVVKSQGDRNILELQVKENPVTQSVNLSGNTVFPDSILKRHLMAMVGVPYNPQMLEGMLTNLLHRYRRAGYPLARVDSVRWKPENGVISIQVSEGQVNAIRVEGNRISQRFVVTREVNFNPGDPVRNDRVNRSITNIYSTELFDYAGVEFIPAPESDGWDVVFHVLEKRYLSTKFGYKVNNQRGNAGIITLEHQNFRGRGVRVSTELKMGTEEFYAHGHYSSNRLFKSYITYNFAVGYEWDWHRIYEEESDFQISNFTIDRSFVSYSLGHQIARLGLVDFTGKAQRVIIGGPASLGDRYNSDYTLVSLAASSVIDTKDRTVFAQTGNYQMVSYETASKTIAGDRGFSRFELQTDWYFTFLERNTIHPGIRIGVGDQTLPFSEWFTLGGIDSFFGLQEMQVRGNKLYRGSLEYRYRMPVSSLFDLNFYTRYDIAAFSREVLYEISRKDFFHGVGIGVGVTTPAGPLKLGYGETSRGDDAFYFYFGWDF